MSNMKIVSLIAAEGIRLHKQIASERMDDAAALLAVVEEEISVLTDKVDRLTAIVARLEAKDRESP